MRDGMLLCRPRHAAYPLARLAFSRRVKLRIPRWSAGHRLKDFWEDRSNISLIIPQVSPTELGGYCVGIVFQVQNTYLFRISADPGFSKFESKSALTPAATCKTESSVLSHLYFCSVMYMYMYIPVSAEHITPHPNPQDPKWTTRPRNQKPQRPAHPLIRVYHPSSPLTVPPSPQFQNNPKQPHLPTRSPFLRLSGKKAKDNDNKALHRVAKGDVSSTITTITWSTRP
jgi:hypothetical protein